MKPTSQQFVADITIHDVHQSGELGCLRKFLDTIEATKRAGLISSAINRRDPAGRTLLHRLAASEHEAGAIRSLELLARNPLLQLNIPDLESGWTALHRALYHGNLRFARVLIDLLECDLKIKDHEGLSAFDLYHSTIERAIHSSSPHPPHTDLFTWGSNRNFVLGIHDDGDRHHPERIHLTRPKSSQTHPADPATANPFISTPVSFVAIGRLHTALIAAEGELRVCGFGSGGRLGLPPNSRSNGQDRPAPGISAETQFTFAPVNGSGLAHQKVKSVALGQDHTVVITQHGQVYTFGMNRFGQLGYAPDSPGATLENMIQVEPKRVLGLLKKVNILGAAASRWHTAVFSADSLFTWGANRGQLGYHNPHPHNSLASIQITPRKVAIAHTSIIQLSCTSYETAYLCEHSSEVYVLKSEVTIRVVFPFDRFPPEIHVSGMPGNQGHTPATRILQLDSSDQTLAAVSSMGDVYIIDLENPNPLENPISYGPISSSPHRSNTAMTPAGPTFKPRRIWCSTKWANAARHVAVGLDGDVIITTMAGHVYTSYRRPTANGALKAVDNRTTEPPTATTKKSYKFQRVHGLQRVSHVAANPTGSYAAIRTDVALRDIQHRLPEENIPLAAMLASMLPHLKKCASSVPEVHTVPSAPHPSRATSTPIRSGTSPSSEVQLDADDGAVEDEEDERDDLRWDARVGSALFGLSLNWSDHQPTSTLDCGDIFVVAHSGEKIMAHRVILCARSSVLDQILNRLISVDGITYRPGEPGADEIEQGCATLPTLRFDDHELLTLLLFIHYIYTDHFPSIWDNRVWPQLEHAHHGYLCHTGLSGKPPPAVAHVAVEAKDGLQRLARRLGLSALDRALARLGKTAPAPLLSAHFAALLPASPRPSPDTTNADHHLVPTCHSSNMRPDMELALQDGAIIPCHSLLMRAQCPFFRLMYDHEVWVSGRKHSQAAGCTSLIRIDMSHLASQVLHVVLLHIYTDSDDLFRAEDFRSLNDFIDFVFDVMAAANELMMDKLKYICSVVLRRCVNLSNVTAIAAEADFYRADSLKETCMNYMMHNLDALFADKALIKIPDDLLMALATYLKRVQMDQFPVSRSPQIMQELMAHHAQFLCELDLPKSWVVVTTRHWKSLARSLTHHSGQSLPDVEISFDKKGPRGSVELGPRQPINGNPLPPSYSSHSPPSDPVSRSHVTCSDPSVLDPCPAANAPSTKPLDCVNETNDYDAPFVMDEFESAASPTTKGLSKMRLNPSSTSNDCSAWATPIKKVTPIDLRTALAVGKQRGPSQPHVDTSPANSSPRLPSDLTPSQKLSQREKRRQSAEASKSRPDSTSAASAQKAESKAPAWRSISSGSDRKIPGPSGQALPALMSSASLSCSPSSSHVTAGPPKNVHTTVVLPGRVQGVVAKNPGPTDPASAVGASVITPTRAVNGIGASNSSRRALAGQDTPWTNYVSASAHFVYAGPNSSPFDSTSNLLAGPHDETKCEGNTPHTILGSNVFDIPPSCDPATPAGRPTSYGKPTNFSTIQDLQAQESWALYGAGKHKPRLAQIQEEENRRLVEKRREEQFLKWFEEESLRLQIQSTPPHSRSKRSSQSARAKPGLATQSGANNEGNSLGRHHKEKKGPRGSHLVTPDPQDSQASKPVDCAVPSHDLATISPRGKKKPKPAKSMLSKAQAAAPSSGPSTPTPPSPSAAAKTGPCVAHQALSSTTPTFASQQHEHLPSLLHHNSSRVKAN